MQAEKNAMETMREKAANVGASAKAGMDKTKAVVEEKVEKATAQHPAEKQMAEHKKQARIHEAELAKRKAMEYNAAVKECNDPAEEGVAHTGPTELTTDTARPGAAHQPSVETNYPGSAVEGVAHTGPTGLTTDTARPSAAHQPTVETGYPTGPGMGPNSA